MSGHRGRAAALLVTALAVLGFAVPGTVGATFTGTHVNGAPTPIGASSGLGSTFLTHSQAVAAGSPVSRYRTTEAQTASPGTTTADTGTPGGRPATYTSPTASRSATQGPSTWWNFDSATGTTGTTPDSSGAVNTGSLGSGAAVTTAAGKLGDGVHLSGSPGSVVGRMPVDTTGDFTAMVWARLTDSATDYAALALEGPTNSAAALMFRHANSTCTDCWQIRAASTMTAVSSTLQPPVVANWLPPASSTLAGVWWHLAMVYTAPTTAGGTGTLTLYVNGTTQPTSTVPHTVLAAGSHLALGRQAANGGPVNHWNGDLDDARVYQRALSAAEVQAVHNGGSGTTTEAAALTAGLTDALQGPDQGQGGSSAVASDGAMGAFAVRGAGGAPEPAPDTFTIECWLRVGPGHDGQVLGFASDSTSAAPASSDRMLFVDRFGHLAFGVAKPSGFSLLRTPLAVTDGVWHHVAASMGPAGTKLYLDGALMARDAATTAGAAYSGYWRWGASKVYGWSSGGTNVDPSRGALTGTVDEVAVHGTQLTDADVAHHAFSNF
ncbi:LamG domain-containing protein [Kineococcus glutinatus]|uniref:LamG-like jellyroll fold domain-containing protein n=1 Tax=Kineococcus glutinatus TaxID=1070872 RepID=A0ABP9I3M6_9ACTN